MEKDLTITRREKERKEETMANMQDVAKLANVSVTTVSRVINNRKYVNEETKQIVLEAIQTLDYVPNELARSFYYNSSKMIGLLIYDLKNDFYNQFITRIESQLIEKGYSLMIGTTQGNPEREAYFLNLFLANNIDGLILCTNLCTQGPLLQKVLKLPLVSVGRVLSDEVSSVSADNTSGGQLAAQILIQNRCREILFINGPKTLHSVQEKSAGFYQVMDQYPEIHVHEVVLDFVNVTQTSFDQLFHQWPSIDGIFAASDFLAACALRSLHSLDKKIGEAIQVIGYENTNVCLCTSPLLSSIARPLEEMVDWTTQLLFQEVQGDKTAPRHVLLKNSFVPRETTQWK